MVGNLSGLVYCITTQLWHKHFVVCTSESELCEYVAEYEIKGNMVTSVNQLCCDGSTPRIAVRSNPYYKAYKNTLNKM